MADLQQMTDLQRQLLWLIRVAKCSCKMLADATGTDRSTISRWIHGKILPTTEHAEILRRIMQEAMIRVARVSPLHLPPAAYHYVCARGGCHGDAVATDAGPRLTTELALARSNSSAWAAASALSPSLATVTSIAILHVQRVTNVDACTFRAELGRKKAAAAAFIILIDRELPASRAVEALLTELNHVAYHVLPPPLPPMNTESYMNHIHQDVPSQPKTKDCQ